MPDPVVLVFDTNVLVRDLQGQSIGLWVLAEVADRIGVQVVIPQVVLDEFERHCSEKVEELAALGGKYRSQARRLLGATGVNLGPIVFDSGAALREMTASYRAMCRAEGWRVGAYPAVSHGAVVARLHSGLKPFGRREREVGYRDYLIWRTALEAGLSSDALVVLVTDNQKDFYSEGALHPELASEASEQGVRIEVCTGLPDVLDRWALPRLPSGLKHNSEHWARRLASFFASDEYSELCGPDYSIPYNFGLPLHADVPMFGAPENWRIEAVHEYATHRGGRLKTFASIVLRGDFVAVFVVEDRLVPMTRIAVESAWKVLSTQSSLGETWFHVAMNGRATIQWIEDEAGTSPDEFHMRISPRPRKADFG